MTLHIMFWLLFIAICLNGYINLKGTLKVLEEIRDKQ